MKIVIGLIMSLMILTVPLSNVLAINAGQEMVAIGSNLTDEQRKTVYDYFEKEENSVNEVDITIDDEKKYLENVDPSRIGSKSLSSIYILTRDKGEGLDITLHNIDWLTKDIYENALTTVGITDAKIVIASPINVSGTAALTGVYKAYEQMSGEKVPEETKQAATEELVTTGELSDDIGSDDAANLVNELKLSMDDIKDADDSTVKEKIKEIADEKNITLTDDQVEKLLKLARNLENVDLSSVSEQLQNISDKFNDSGLWDKIVNFVKGLF